MTSDLRLLALTGAVLLTGCFGGGSYTPIRTPFNKGVFHYSRGDYEAAIAEYREALSEDPSDLRSRFNLALALEGRAGELEASPGDGERAKRLRAEAERTYRDVLSRRPDDLRAGVNLAAIEYERGEREAAMARLGRAIEEHPDAALPRAARAAHLIRANRLEEARTELLEAREREPADPMVNALLGRVAHDLGYHDEARSALEAVLLRSPGDLGALLAMGRLLLDQGDRMDAIDIYRRAVLVHPGCREAHLRLSDLYSDSDETLEQATLHLWQARRIGGGADVDYRGRLLDLYRRLSERERK